MGATVGSLSLPLNESGMMEISLCVRTFADAPQQQPLTRQASSNSQSSPHAARMAGSEARPEDFIFSDVRASRYAEYNVIKVNHRGTRQARVLGIDRERFYNMATGMDAPKDGTKGIGAAILRGVGLQSSDGTKRPYRNIRDLIGVRMVGPEEPCGLHVVFSEGIDEAGRKEYRYEASSGDEAAEIVAKLRHLIGMHQQQMQSKGAIAVDGDDAPDESPLGGSSHGSSKSGSGRRVLERRGSSSGR